MKLLIISCLIFGILACTPALATAQEKKAVVQQAGECSVNIAGKNNTASLVCNGVDPKLAEQARAILNGSRRSESAAKEISAKLDQILKQINKETAPPTVALRFVYPESPALVLVNQSDVVAKNTKWLVALWNVDLPDRDDPLPIPVSTFDWIRPKDESGPLSLFGNPQVTQLLKPGNHLLGSATVICPDCARGRTYFVSIVWGVGGWFSEVAGEQTGRVLVPQNFMKATRSEYFKELEAAVPAESRIPIGN